ncbi:MAG: hypothetical protein H6825_01185 [Planctomycetes bacterium]|nr:hypothetical protein [Planctomycetota bacterium]
MTPPTTVRFLVLAALLACATPLRADVIVVDFDVDGFNAFSLAVAAASDGDTLLVRPASQSLDTLAVIDGKSLVIVGDDTQPVPIAGSLEVSHLAADQSVTLRNLALMPIANDPALSCHDDAGLLFVEDCVLRGADGLSVFFGTEGLPGVAADGCAGVTLVRCTVRGGDGSDSGPPFSHPPTAMPGGPGLTVDGADMTLSDCTVTGGTGGTDGSTPEDEGAPGGAGLVAHAAHLLLSGVTVQGGAGGDHCSPALADSCDGGDGLVLDGSVLLFQQQCLFVAGAGGSIVGGGNASPGSDTSIAPGDTVADLPHAPRALVVASPTRENQLTTIRYEGQQGDTFGLFFALAPGYLPLPFKEGVFALGFPPQGPLVVTVTAPDGVFEVPFVAWDVTSFGLEAATLYGQCFLKDTGHATLLSGPSALTILAGGF